MRINTASTPLLPPSEKSQENCVQRCMDKLACVVLAPERACGSIVRKVADWGQKCGLGIRAAKISLVVTSSAVLLELGSFIARQYLNINGGMATLAFIRPMSLVLSVITLNHCLPLSSTVTCGVFFCACGSGESRLGWEIRQSKEWIPRSVLLSILVSSIINGVMIHNSPIASSKEIAELVCGGIIAFTSVWMAVGLCELIRRSHAPVVPLALANNV